jgi:hypothetical protein
MTRTPTPEEEARREKLIRLIGKLIRQTGQPDQEEIEVLLFVARQKLEESFLSSSESEEEASPIVPPPVPQPAPLNQCRFCLQLNPNHIGRHCPQRNQAPGTGSGLNGGGPHTTTTSGELTEGQIQGLLRLEHPPKFYALWNPESVGGVWLGRWGILKGLFPTVVGKKVASFRAGREYLLGHGNAVFSGRALRTAM